jgi:hypothetical protein
MAVVKKKILKAKPKAEKKPVVKKPIPKNKPKNKPKKKPATKLKVSKSAPKRASVAIIAKRPLRVPPPPKKSEKKSETKIGEVTHYYAQIGVAVIQVDQKPLHIGDMIHVRGHTTDFTQAIPSMEVEHQSVSQVRAGALFGMKVTQHVRVGDIVYKL